MSSSCTYGAVTFPSKFQQKFAKSRVFEKFVDRAKLLFAKMKRDKTSAGSSTHEAVNHLWFFEYVAVLVIVMDLMSLYRSFPGFDTTEYICLWILYHVFSLAAIYGVMNKNHFALYGLKVVWLAMGVLTVLAVFNSARAMLRDDLVLDEQFARHYAVLSFDGIMIRAVDFTNRLTTVVDYTELFAMVLMMMIRAMSLLVLLLLDRIYYHQWMQTRLQDTSRPQNNAESDDEDEVAIFVCDSAKGTQVAALSTVR